MRRHVPALVRSRWASPLLLVLLLVAFAGLGLRWIRTYRQGGLLDIDEAGYQSMAVSTFRGWESGGIAGWWDAFLAPSIQAPLMPAVTTPYYDVAGIGALVGLLVPLSFGVVSLAASYALGRRISPAVGWGTALLVAATPAVISFSRTYNFAIAAAATVALTFWAVARSRNFHSPVWSLLVGVFAGLAILARTLNLALMPGLALAAVIAVAAGPARGRRALNVLLAAIGSAIVAGPWYWRNGEAVWDYLTSFGYGSRRAEYGSDESLSSLTSWIHSAQYAIASLGLPVVTLWLLGAVLLAVAALRRRPALEGSGSPTPLGARWARSTLMPSAVFVAWSLLILTSTGNKGSGFLLPLVPPASLLVAAAFAATWRPVRTVGAVALVGLLLVNTTASAGTAFAERRSVQVPTIGDAELVDGRGELQLYIAAGMIPPSSAVQPIAVPTMRMWTSSIGRVARGLDALQPNVVMFGFRHRLMNPNSVQFAQLSAGRGQLPMGMLSPLELPDEATMASWLAPGGPGGGVCTLLLSTGLQQEIEPYLDQQALREAAWGLGFRPTDETWEMPGPRSIKAWQRC